MVLVGKSGSALYFGAARFYQWASKHAFKEDHVSILGASTALTRYRVVETVTDDFLQTVPQRLKEFRFRDIDDTADERSFGWTNVENMLDTKFEESSPEKGAVFFFTLRLETRRVQPAVLRKHLLITLANELEQAKAQGRGGVSRARKMELKEQVTLRLRARSLPVPALFDCVWNPGANRVLFESSNAKARALFEDVFQMTFDLHLEPLAPAWLALDMLGSSAETALGRVEPALFATE